VDDVALGATGKDDEEVTAKLEACAAAAGESAQANAVSFDEGKAEAVLFWKGRKEIPAGKIKVGNHQVAYNKEATRWLGVYLDSPLTLKEHHRTRMRKARQAEGRLRRLTGQFGLADTRALPKNPGRVRPSKCPLWLGVMNHLVLASTSPTITRHFPFRMSARVGGSSVRVCFGCAMFVLVVRCLFGLCDEKAWVFLRCASIVLADVLVHCSLRSLFVCLFVLSLWFVMFLLWLRVLWRSLPAL